jgi:ABC-type multidrug transport system fused ATPase/permease subunit
VIGPKGVLKEKTRVLVTHRVSVLTHVDQIIVLKDGTISESGSFEKLIANKGNFAEFVKEYMEEKKDSEVNGVDVELMKEILGKIEPIFDKYETTNSLGSNEENIVIKRQTCEQSSKFCGYKEDSGQQTNQVLKLNDKQSGQLIEEETSKTGSINLEVYGRYFKLIGFFSTIFILLTYTASNLAQVLTSLWLSEWSNDSLDSNKTNDKNLRDLRLGVYAGIGCFECAFLLIANLLSNLSCIRAAKFVHNKMLKHIIRAPISFFGENFSKLTKFKI